MCVLLYIGILFIKMNHNNEEINYLLLLFKRDATTSSAAAAAAFISISIVYVADPRAHRAQITKKYISFSL